MREFIAGFVRYTTTMVRVFRLIYRVHHNIYVHVINLHAMKIRCTHNNDVAQQIKMSLSIIQFVCSRKWMTRYILFFYFSQQLPEIFSILCV